MAENNKKKIWLRVIRRYLGTDDDNISKEIVCVDIEEGQTGNQIKKELIEVCQLQSVDRIVFKLRNHRGSIIPITGKLPVNTSSGPYTLEVVKEHQFVKPQPRTVKQTYHETVREKLTEIMNRVEKLEASSPGLKERSDAKINKEMEELQQTLVFLNKRFSDAEAVHWKGMFKKNPLW